METRTRKAGFRVLGLTLVLTLLIGGFALPASATTTLPGPCSGGYHTPIPFGDVAPTSPHKADIECISAWGITVNQGTYNPSALVSRWQMALFLTRTYDILWLLPNGDPQGFADIGAFPADQQAAINQLKQLSITGGTTPTTFDPHGAVTRWQMALFLTRLIHAAAEPLPPGTDQGFTDLGGLSAEAQVAINQLKQLGISTGASPTTFAPHEPVTREQMASFLARTLGVIWHFNAYLEADELQCDASNNCNGAGYYWANQPFAIGSWWAYDYPFPTQADQDSFNSDGTYIEIRIDGSAVPTTERWFVLGSLAIIYFEAEIPGGLSGVHTITLVYYQEGQVVSTDNISFDFSL